MVPRKTPESESFLEDREEGEDEGEERSLLEFGVTSLMFLLLPESLLRSMDAAREEGRNGCGQRERIGEYVGK